MYDDCEYPYFKANPSDIIIEQQFFRDNIIIDLPVSSLNTDSMTLIRK